MLDNEVEEIKKHEREIVLEYISQLYEMHKNKQVLSVLDFLRDLLYNRDKE